MGIAFSEVSLLTGALLIFNTVVGRGHSDLTYDMAIMQLSDVTARTIVPLLHSEQGFIIVP
jgi:hypothetical protein